jgi:hypothetical protein
MEQATVQSHQQRRLVGFHDFSFLLHWIIRTVIRKAIVRASKALVHMAVVEILGAGVPKRRSQPIAILLHPRIAVSGESVEICSLFDRMD